MPLLTCGPGGVAKAREGQAVEEGEKKRRKEVGRNRAAGAVFSPLAQKNLRAQLCGSGGSGCVKRQRKA